MCYSGLKNLIPKEYVVVLRLWATRVDLLLLQPYPLSVLGVMADIGGMCLGVI